MSEKLAGIIKIVNKLNEDEYIFLRELFLKKYEFTNDEIEKIEEEYATRNMNIFATKNSDDVFYSTKYIYNDELMKINNIIRSDELVKKLRGLKIMFYGPTGTGKTTLAKELINLNPSIRHRILNLEEIISPRFGQTQKNLLDFANQFEGVTQKTILFIDEIDSFISNRKSISNDVGEHARVVATFLKFLDSLNENIIVFSATNIIETIDDAIFRRFNLKIEGKLFDFNKFVELFNYEAEDNMKISISFINSIEKFNKHVKFSISDIRSFEEHLFVESSVRNDIDSNIELIVFFNNKISIGDIELSRRRNSSLKNRKVNRTIRMVDINE